MFLLLALEIFHTFSAVSSVDFGQVDVSWDFRECCRLEDNRASCCFRRIGVLQIYDGAFWGK